MSYWRIFQRIGGTAEKCDIEFSDAFVYNHAIPQQPCEPVAKMNCFGWYILGQLAMDNLRIQSADVGTISMTEEFNILLQQDLIGFKPTKRCTCSDNVLRNMVVKEPTAFVY